ncbi:mandelate racemase/muconate lactonizing enzyme family protein [Vibrio sp. S9_S30]|uniref:mandelate racemase/muconate lactonizing enzyme family protein n=1 Tax=Vibrio sp. S9_S30 TaxID=2720226 RepID=UPI001681066C|nr:mandelate racemase/muconate lactonizing enzyme family protein [Vibrio sp. S9_S30]MBD1557805.1 mandelate racemase/muconate lactonizing enzyme family protein [Vibrio sp. S9_S30]
MKIIKIETIQCKEFSNILWIRIHTDEGIVGTGETFRNPEAVATHIHETCATYLLGKDPMRVDYLIGQLRHSIGSYYRGYPTRSVETRGTSAIDIALWDIVGQALNAPLYTLFGGLVNEKVRVYNTCASPQYNAISRAGRETVNPSSLLDAPKTGDDLWAQFNAPDELAESLLEQGITAMKIWPFDRFAYNSQGREIRLSDIKQACEPIERIRKAVGDKMDILLELHGLWLPQPARQIGKAIEEYGLYWVEEPMAMHRLDDLERYANEVSTPVCGSECMGTKEWYRDAFARGAIDIANFDIAWVGGLTESRKIAALADSFGRTIAPHDCTGPIVLAANNHLALSQSNTLISECVRSHIDGFYQEIVTELPIIEDGYIQPTSGAGLGTRLSDKFLSRKDLTIREISL